MLKTVSLLSHVVASSWRSLRDMIPSISGEIKPLVPSRHCKRFEPSLSPVIDLEGSSIDRKRVKRRLLTEEWKHLGLVNNDDTGTLNNCFFNSALQVLMRLDVVRSIAKTSDSEAVTVLSSFLDLIYPIPMNNPFDSSVLRDAILPASQFPVREQHDAADVFLHILENTSLGRCARFTRRVSDQCMACERCVTKAESFNALGTYIPDHSAAANLQDMVDDITEYIDDFTCPDCARVRVYVRETRVQTPPEVLIVQIRRYGGTMVGNAEGVLNFEATKLECQVVTPLTGLKVAGREYRLHGIINHMGLTPNAGHYTATVLDEGGQWFNYNDEVVTEVSAGSVIQPSEDVYLAVYVVSL